MLGQVLARLRARYPDMELRGLGGAAAIACGLEPLVPLERTAVSGAWDVLRRAVSILGVYRVAMATLERFRPDLVLLVDYPGLNLRLARRARALGFPVQFIAPPQAWAYRQAEKRTRRAVRALEGCAVHVLFPFEAPAFAASAHRVTAGHFLVTETAMRPEAPAGGAPGNPILCLCPGSRLPVLRRNLPVWLDRLLGEDPPPPWETQILVPAHLEGEATSLVRSFLSHRSNRSRRMDRRVNRRQDFRAVQSSLGAQAGMDGMPPAPSLRVRTDKDPALVEASWAVAYPGTITLELALRRVPALVLAVLDPLTLAVGRRILAHPHRLGLPNLLLGEDLFPEWAGSAANLTREDLHRGIGALQARKPAWDGAWESIQRRLEAVIGTGNGAEICARECLAMLETAGNTVENLAKAQIAL